MITVNLISSYKDSDFVLALCSILVSWGMIRHIFSSFPRYRTISLAVVVVVANGIAVIIITDQRRWWWERNGDDDFPVCNILDYLVQTANSWHFLYRSLWVCWCISIVRSMISARRLWHFQKSCLTWRPFRKRSLYRINFGLSSQLFSNTAYCELLSFLAISSNS